MIRSSCFALALLFGSLASAQTCTTSWSAAVDGDWADASRWTAGVPGSSDTACITESGTYAVMGPNAAISVDALVIGGASGTQTFTLRNSLALGSAGNIRVNGVMEWTTNYIESGTLTNEGLVRLTGTTGSRGVRGDGSVFRNEGTVAFESIGRFYSYGGSRIENAGLWRIEEAGDLWGFNGAGAFVNEAGATLRKEGEGLSQVIGGALTLENDGLIDVAAGELRFDRPSTHNDARLEVADDALLVFSGGGVRFEGTLTGTPAGTLRLQNAFDVADAVWNVNGSGVEWTTGYLEGGTLTNQGLLRLAGPSGSRGARGGTARVRNTGTVEFSGTGLFYVYDNARVENASLWRITEGGDLWGFSGVGTFANTGTLEVSGADLTQVVGGALVFENAGAIDVQNGELRFDRPSTHTRPAITVSPGASLVFQSNLATFVGRLEFEPEGVFRIQSPFAVADGTVWNVGGTGVEWASNNFESGRLINEGLVRLTGTGAKRVQGETSLFRNDGTVEWESTGALALLNGGRVENTGLWDILGDGDLFGTTTPGQFLNRASGTFRKSGGTDVTRIYDNTFQQVEGLSFVNEGTVEVQTGAIHSERPFEHREGARIQGTGTFEVNDQFVNQGDTAPGDPLGELAWTGTFAPEATSALRIGIGGTTPGTDYDHLRIDGQAELDGQLVVDLLDAYVPASGDVFTILTAESVGSTLAGGGLSGGFELIGLTDADANISLYPDFGETTLTLTASIGIPTVSGALAVAPEEVVNGGFSELVLTGTGFAPDVTVRLVCTSCFDPDGAGEARGVIRSITPTEIVTLVDLRNTDTFGSYDVVVTDPRGGTARSGITVTDGPPLVSVSTLDAQASETGRDPGLFVITSDRPLRSPVEVPIRLSGSAVQYADYMTDAVRNRVIIPAGTDSLVVSVFPLSDSESEPTESVSIQILYEGETGQRSASLTITDGPPEDAFDVYVSTPDAVANLGEAVITIGGQGFSDGTTASLLGNGTLDAVATEINDARTILTARFALNGQPLGPRDLVVTSGGGEERTLSGAVTLEGPIYPEVSVRVLAPPRVPRTRERTYTILLRNQGNVDVLGYPSLSGLPVGTEWETDFEAQPANGGTPIPWHEISEGYESEENGLVITMPLVLLPAGGSREIEVRAAIGQPQTLRLSAAWQYMK